MIEKFLNKAAGSLQPALYVVATPIGNLADITLRALAVLGRADLVCAEDTRVTAQLLAAYGIQAKLMSVREHNEQQMADKVVAALSDGLIVAQVSDAGTPAVCDPGARLGARLSMPLTRYSMSSVRAISPSTRSWVWVMESSDVEPCLA